VRALNAPVVVVAGPTASGKSALALGLAEAFGGTVINADSMQVYAGLEILTSQPDRAAKDRCPHRLYGVLDAADACSAARWRDLALEEIGFTEEAGRVPILVGGTGLYLRTLAQGIVPVPAISADVRAEARRLHGEIGGEAFRAELAKVDPESAGRLHPSDGQRLIRAYEVALGTGVALSEWQRRANDESPKEEEGLRFFTIVLDPPRADLRASIAARLEAMVAAGALDEVRALTARNLDPELPAMKALGVRELAGHLAGTGPLEAAISAASLASGQYAKRQATWFRHQMVADISLTTKYSESLKADLQSKVSKFLLTRKD
jgi:tRNA dimethylallyltransferase